MDLISPSEFAKEKVLSVQEYCLLAARSVGSLFQRPRYLRDILIQCDLIGVGSLPIVILTGFFSWFGAGRPPQSNRVRSKSKG